MAGTAMAARIIPARRSCSTRSATSPPPNARPFARSISVAAPESTAGSWPAVVAPITFHPPDEAQVEAMFRPRFAAVDIDEYRTTYENGRLEEHNFLVTFVR